MARGGAPIAGTNRSGTKRRRAMSENSTADGPEAGRNLVERPPDQQQAVSADLNGVQLEMDKDRDKTGSEGDGDSVIEEGGRENQEREVVHLSLTNFDSARMPRTVTASVFTNAKTTAHSLRVQINKSLKKCDQQVQILEELDQLIITGGEEDSDNEEVFDEVQSELSEAFDKIKKWNK